MNRNEFRALMVKHGDRRKDLADYLGIHPNTLYYKFSGCGDRCHFTLSEVKMIMERYNLSPEDVVRIFLN